MSFSVFIWGSCLADVRLMALACKIILFSTLALQLALKSRTKKERADLSRAAMG